MAGELKHGPLALVDSAMPIIFVGTKDSTYEKMKNCFNQITSRKGEPIVLCNEDEAASLPSYFTLPIPATEDCLQGLLNIVPLQLLSYHIAVLRGANVDQPRNLAKSVTVE
ncbi:MAG: SIS domain-containing protein [Actinobacteria bacterium]|nr:SIS domain-containing protein [Actinomycetota bacterium]